MIVLRLIALVYLFTLIDSNPIFRQYEHRQRRNLQLASWQSADALYKHLYEHDDYEVDEEKRNKRSETPQQLRPIEGPMNIEQLPAMLAARYVKRYPFSQRDDPAVIGR